MNGDGRRAWAVTVLGMAAILLLAIYFWLTNQQARKVSRAAGVQETEPGGAIRAYFSPPEEATRSRGGLDSLLAADLAQVDSSIDAALYDLDLWSVRDVLLAAHRRGVRVRLVVEGENRAKSVILDLESAGIEVHSDDRPPLMHHKFLVLDEEVIWTGSLNWTVNGVYRNNNNVLVLSSRDLAANFTREFEEMFMEGRYGELSRADTPYPFLVVGDAAVEVAFSPDDGAQARVLSWLDGARRSVDVMAFTLTANPVAEAFFRIADRGVTVRGVVEAERTGDLGSDVRGLRGQGLDLRLDINPATMHHKVIVIDGETVITGSYNFTRSAEERNDENVLIVLDPAIGHAYSQEFERLYEEALP